MLFRKMNRFFLLLLAMGFIKPLELRAHHPGAWEPGNRPLLEGNLALEPFELEILLRVGFRGLNWPNVDQDDISWLHDPVFYLARIRVEGGIPLGDHHHGSHHYHPHQSHSHWIDHLPPHLEIAFIPLSLEGYREASAVSFAFLETQLRRDVHMNEDLSLQVHAVGVRVGQIFSQRENLDAILSVAARSLGFVTRQYAQEISSVFTGMTFGDVLLEATQRLHFSDFILSFAAGVGGGAHLSLRDERAMAWDQKTYAELRFDLNEHVRVYTGAYWHALSDRRSEQSWSSLEFLTGITLQGF
jgi:hypothetical protein